MAHAFYWKGELVKMCKACMHDKKQKWSESVYPVNQFNIDNSTADGYTYQCKKCQAARARDLYNTNKTRTRGAARHAQNTERTNGSAGKQDSLFVLPLKPAQEETKPAEILWEA